MFAVTTRGHIEHSGLDPIDSIFTSCTRDL